VDTKLKEVVQVIDDRPILSDALLGLGKWMSWYYLAPLGEVFRVMLPPGLLARRAAPGTSHQEFWPSKRRLAVVAVSLNDENLTDRQREVARLLRESDLPVLLSDLAKATGASSSVLKSLEKKGVVEIKKIDVRRSPKNFFENQSLEKHSLSLEQTSALKVILERLEQNRFSSLLVHGVTASGKTEVYLNAIRRVVNRGKSALVLVPEIGLTPQMSRRFRSWFGDDVAILHSALSDGERFDQWNLIRIGSAKVVVGTRSAVFAPVANLGLIIVDEEHDSSYKQSDQPRYNGRDTAIKRGQLEGALVILGSATPQLETYHNSAGKKSTEYLSLSSRILDRPLPAVQVVDMRAEFQKRGKATVISELLEESIKTRLDRREQTLVLLNRRGYASAVLCRSCGNTETCHNCSISLTFHQQSNCLSCHYCGYTRSVPTECGECGKEYVYFVGEGTEKVQEILCGLFPTANIDRMDRDRVRRKGQYERILGGVASGATDILVGTQMIAKGHDFPGVTLVGVLGADQGLRLADFRSAERTFQLLTQVAGRAGRGEQPGEVIIQTYYPNHYSLKCACEQDFNAFAERELSFRQRFRYPPFTALANIIVHRKDFEKAWTIADTIASRLIAIRKQLSSSSRLRVLGPASAAIEKLKNDFRVQILVKTTDRLELHTVLERAFAELRAEKVDLRRIAIDVDPVDLM
jgi:primosomal protein N' (replication factor Y)